MASTSSSSAAVAALAQKASQQYLECRRRVTAKVDEVKALDAQLQAAFSAMDSLRGRGGAGAKSVGRLEVTLVGVAGESPAPNATITVAIDPEFEADEDEYDEVEEVVEKRDVVTTDEHGHVVEPGSLAPVHEDGSTPRKLKTTTKITRTIIKKKVKKAPKPPAVRTIAWDAGEAIEEQQEEAQEEAENAEESEKSEESQESQESGGQKEEAAPKALTFPATFVFDPVQSREAVVILTVAAADEEDAEPIKEVEFPVSRLFQDTNGLDQWFLLADDEEKKAEAEVATVQVEEVAAEMPKTFAEVVAEEVAETQEEAAKTQEETAEDKEEATEEAEKADEEQKEVAAETAEGEAEEAEEQAGTVEEAEEAVESVEEVAKEEPAVVGARFRVKATFAMSEIEQLSAAAMALSKQKQEADAALQELEREAASLRTKFERLNASQRSLSASGLSKPKSLLLSSRFASQPAAPKSQFQKAREAFSAALTPQRQQVLTSLAIFVSSVALFHYQGENLLM